jgi:hypothetical protein
VWRFDVKLLVLLPLCALVLVVPQEARAEPPTPPGMLDQTPEHASAVRRADPAKIGVGISLNVIGAVAHGFGVFAALWADNNEVMCFTAPCPQPDDGPMVAASLSALFGGAALAGGGTYLIVDGVRGDEIAEAQVTIGVGSVRVDF